MAEFAATAGTGLSVLAQCGSDTDIGGGRENQDDCFIHTSAGIVILCVLDGHGREVGKVAANTARQALIAYFTQCCPILAASEDVRAATYECLVQAHNIAHAAIRDAFRATMESQGFEVEEAEGGYLRKRRGSVKWWSCIHGGSSCSIVAIVKNKCYVANVGDSSGIICGYHKVLNQAMMIPIGDAAKGGLLSASKDEENKDSMAMEATSANNNFVSGPQITDTVIITAEHSPECPDEFVRLRSFRANEQDPRFPSLSVVYDKPQVERSDCPPVFRLDEHGTPHVLNSGTYYKNVRKEWASLVATPSTAEFQDALAFTRSLGDLHLHTYGVTHEPEVQCFDLDSLWTDLDTSNQLGSELLTGDVGGDDVDPRIAASCFCIVLATDGVWDNWAYEDVTRFVMHSSCISAVQKAPDGAQRVAQSFMQRNAVYARRNFGAQADNATGIIAYIGKSDSGVFATRVVNSV